MSEVALFRAIILRALQDAGGNTGMSRDGHHDRLVVEAQNWFREMGSDFDKPAGLLGSSLNSLPSALSGECRMAIAGSMTPPSER